MDVKQKLEDLIVLQDSITHLNAKGLEESEEATQLCLKRDALRKEIAKYVGHLQEGLQLIIDKPDTFDFPYEVAQSIAVLSLGVTDEEDAEIRSSMAELFATGHA